MPLAPPRLGGFAPSAPRRSMTARSCGAVALPGVALLLAGGWRTGAAGRGWRPRGGGRVAQVAMNPPVSSAELNVVEAKGARPHFW